MSASHLSAGGITFPKLGLGTFQLSGQACTQAVLSALEIGYRHIDTAEMYGNETEVGLGLAQSGVPREQVHVTSKVWYENLAPNAIEKALNSSLKRLACEYLDLYLIHWPAPNMNLAASLEKLAALKMQGKIRAFGVSNFTVALLKQAVELSPSSIACNQVEFHALLGQEKLLSTAQSLGVPLVAYSPIARGQVANEPVLIEIAKKHGASPTQVALKWLLAQDGVGAIPKASKPTSQRSNFEAQKLKLGVEDIAAINAMPKTRRFVNPAFSPKWD